MGAQQIMLDTKARDKDNKNDAKGKGKEKEQPANAQGKSTNLVYINPIYSHCGVEPYVEMYSSHAPCTVIPQSRILSVLGNHYSSLSSP